MKLQTLQDLRCPYCASPLEIAEGIDIKEGNINQALVKCNCNIYPLIAGILVLKNNIPNSNYLTVLSLKNRKPKQALYYLIKPRLTLDRLIQAAYRRKLIFSRFADNIRAKLIGRYVNKMASKHFFSDCIAYLRMGGYGEYFLHRFSSTSFLASLPLILLLKNFPGPVLEIGSGMGHYGFMISSFYPQKELVCVDASFINLFLAKRFFAPQAEFICLDANDPLPFADRKFNIIFSSDALHYLYSKRLVMQEVSRISKESAIVLLAHLHNLKGKNPVQGLALTADGWLKLCSFSCVKLLSESIVFDDFLKNDILNLLDNFTPGELEQADALMLVASNNRAVFENYSNIGEQYFRLDDRLVLNPLYRQLREGSSVRLRKKWPTGFIEAENLTADKIMPDSYVLDEEIIRLVRDNKIAQIDACKITELMKKFILIYAPKKYYDFH